MHRVMILLLLTFTINQALAQQTLTSTDNLVTSLNLTVGQKWAIDGGIFSPVGKEIFLSNPGVYKLLLLDHENQLTQIQVIISGEQLPLIQNSTLYVDTVGPKISLDWINSKVNNNATTVGSKSSVSWSSNENNVSYTSYLNDNVLVDNTSIDGFNKNDSTLKIEASDEFGNATTKIIKLDADFDPPNISWELSEPAIKKNNQWIAGKSAVATIQSTDDSGVKSLMLNNKIISPNQALVSNGDSIQSTDNLGNNSIAKIQWIIDKTSPNYVLNYKDKEYTKKKKINVKVNEDITLSVVDDGVGLKYAKFRNKKKQWEELPKTFTLLSRGSYTIRIVAEDLLGNKLKTKIKIRAKK